jgi:hypothetical protein
LFADSFGILVPGAASHLMGPKALPLPS